MRSTTAATLTIAAILAAPQAAAAKGYAGASVCGTHGCHRVAPAAVRTGLEDFTPAPTPRPEPFFTVRLRARVSSGRIDEVYALEWLPHEGFTRGYGERLWTRPGATLSHALQSAARGLHPRPAAALRDVDERPPEARVAEVFAPARTSDEAAGPPIAATTGLAALLVALLALARRRKRPSATPR
jgi:MYXO-CTERM domain-containing protein